MSRKARAGVPIRPESKKGASRCAPTGISQNALRDQSSSELDALVELVDSLSLAVSLEDLLELSPREP